MSFGRSETFTALLALLHYWDDEDFDKFVCTTFTWINGFCPYVFLYKKRRIF